MSQEKNQENRPRPDHQQQENLQNSSSTAFSIYSAITENTTALLRLFHSDGSYKYVNKAWLDFTGSIFLSDHALTENMHPDSRTPYKAAWEQAVLQNREFSTNYLLLHKRGQYRWVCEFTRPIYSLTGQCEGYLSTGIDMHEQKEHEAYFTAKWSAVLRTAFHDLRGNIGIVSGAASLLQLMDKKEDRDSTLEMMQRNVKQMQSLMDDLLARFSAEKE